MVAKKTSIHSSDKQLIVITVAVLCGDDIDYWFFSQIDSLINIATNKFIFLSIIGMGRFRFSI